MVLLEGSSLPDPQDITRLQPDLHPPFCLWGPLATLSSRTRNSNPDSSSFGWYFDTLLHELETLQREEPYWAYAFQRHYPAAAPNNDTRQSRKGRLNARRRPEDKDHRFGSRDWDGHSFASGDRTVIPPHQEIGQSFRRKRHMKEHENLNLLSIALVAFWIRQNKSLHTTNQSNVLYH